MKFVVSSNLLLTHLRTVGGVIASKNPIPILDCFLFELQGTQLTITAADSETRMVTSIEVNEVEGSGKFAVTSKNLLESLKELPEQPVKFEINDESLAMFIYYKNGKYNFVAQNGEEYPQSKPLNDDAAKLTLSASDLLAGISHTIFATGEDELRPVMNGVFFDISPENITFVASDGHKLVRFKNLSVTGNETATFILPKKPATLLKNILSHEKGEVTIGFDTNNAYITMERFVVVCRLIEGRYPNYNGVIPNNNPYKVTVDRLSLVNALKRVTVFSDSGTNLIKLHFSANSIFISAQDIDFSTSAEETLTSLYDGVDMSIGFKGDLLIEILNNLISEEVIIELADPSRAGIMLPAENEEDEDVLMLLMPMMLNE
ncbi:MAG: DNA polymerase III subunit beta [Candidatus Ordinivivax streblomastigis]|jgi:DNA polymerase-3 subunit beta|uniref:Beta sliding clamp n=1 Tax=Candidatus Ordinivivax streblomastigis TaxID=2540710 RepID=A0A5M8P0H0_9BACT|nr:MAG: DNA polymerase III subunit beta [Candidatus Ordinivivax streblomastigis]MDR2844051.1 DNA polymerase III subunit beta [Candidatus Symbiothrix sp.]